MIPLSEVIEDNSTDVVVQLHPLKNRYAQRIREFFKDRKYLWIGIGILGIGPGLKAAKFARRFGKKTDKKNLDAVVES